MIWKNEPLTSAELTEAFKNLFLLGDRAMKVTLKGERDANAKFERDEMARERGK